MMVKHLEKEERNNFAAETYIVQKEYNHSPKVEKEKPVEKIKLTIKEQIEQIIKEYKEDLSRNHDYAFFNERWLVSCLLNDFNETVEFLENATVEEVGCAIWALDEMVRKFSIEQSKRIINIFRAKKEEFPDVQDYCECVYDEEIVNAEEYIAELKK